MTAHQLVSVFYLLRPPDPGETPEQAPCALPPTQPAAPPPPPEPEPEPECLSTKQPSLPKMQGKKYGFTHQRANTPHGYLKPAAFFIGAFLRLCFSWCYADAKLDWFIYWKWSVSVPHRMFCGRDTEVGQPYPRKKPTKRIKRTPIYTGGCLRRSKTLHVFVFVVLLFNADTRLLTDWLLFPGADLRGNSAPWLNGCIAVTGRSSSFISWCFSVSWPSACSCWKLRDAAPTLHGRCGDWVFNQMTAGLLSYH